MEMNNKCLCALFLLVFAAMGSVTQAEVNSSGRNSHFWITLRPQAGTASGADTDLVLANGYRSVNLSSPDLSCTRVDNGSNWVYQITWTGNSLFGDAGAETLQFNVVVEAFSGATYVYSADENASSVTSLGNDSTPTDIDNNWGVGTDYDIDAGESIRMSQQDFTVDGVDLASSGLALVENEFTNMKVIETNEGYAHKIIFGVGTNLAAASFQQPSETYSVSGESFSVTGAGSNAANREWAISQVSFSFIVRNPSLTVEDTDYPFSDLADGHSYGPTPYEPTTPEKLANAFPQFSWDRIPRTMLVRKGSNSFTNNEARRVANRYDIVVLEKANGGMEGYWDKAAHLKSYNPDIVVVYYWNSRIYYGHNGIDDAIEDPANWDAWIDPDYTIRDWPTYQRENPDLIVWWAGVCHKIMGLIPGYAADGVTPLQDFENWEHGSPIDGYFIDKAGVPVSMLQPLYEGSADYNFCMNNNGDNRDRIMYLDGTYDEGYTGDGSVTAIAKAIALAQESGKNQKLTMLRNPASSPTNKREMEDHIDNTLAYYLAYAEKYAYYYHQKTVDATDADWQWITDYYDQFNRPLGQPFGDAIRDGWIYVRSFERCDLYLDLETDSGGKLSRILWKNDIGSPALAGSGYSSTDDTYTLQGNGNISGTADNFFFLSDLHYGGGEVVVSIDSLDNTHANARAGIMFRERNEPVTTELDFAEDYTAAYRNGTILLPEARMVAVLRDPAGNMHMVYRSTTGGNLLSAGVADAALGPNAKLTRSGGTFTGYTSPDGEAWAEIAQVTLSMAEKVEMGMAVCSGDNSALAQATFSAFSRLEDSDAPTPNPATFAVAPAADSETAISMTATTGSDLNGPVEYYFTETSGNPGGSDSGWQTDPSYTDSGLSAFTQYTYTVTMCDGLGNTGSVSSPASATTLSGGLDNIALAGTASQSSTDHNGAASRAIDGNTSGVWVDGSITHTAEEDQPWWQVDLGDAYMIDEIQIYDRIDEPCCANRLRDYDVSILNCSGDVVWTDHQLDSPEPSVSLDAEGAVGQYVKIQLRPRSEGEDLDPLSLAEVRVLSDGLEAYCGDLTWDGKVDLADYAELASGWQSGYTLDALLDIANDWLAGNQFSLSFDGVDDYVEIPGFTGISGGQARTTCAWIRTSQMGGSILSYGDGTSLGDWLFLVSSTGTLQLGVSGGNIIGTTFIADDQWHHVAAVLEAPPSGPSTIQDLRLYVDGILENGTYANPGLELNTGSALPVQIGTKSNPQNYFYQGLIDDVRIYDRALSDVEIGSIGNVTDGLVAHWNLNEGSGNIAQDFVSGYNGNIYGAQWLIDFGKN